MSIWQHYVLYFSPRSFPESFTENKDQREKQQMQTEITVN